MFGAFPNDWNKTHKLNFIQNCSEQNQHSMAYQVESSERRRAEALSKAFRVSSVFTEAFCFIFTPSDLIGLWEETNCFNTIEQLNDAIINHSNISARGMSVCHWEPKIRPKNKLEFWPCCYWWAVLTLSNQLLNNFFVIKKL